MPPPGPADAFRRKLTAALARLPPSEPYLVGVSGGRDSVALLHGLVEAGYRHLSVCHLDHGLRDPSETAADAKLVSDLAMKLGVSHTAGHTDVPKLAQDRMLSLETAAREARYEFFVDASHNCRTVFLAHHADDQAETFLFNLLRGAGPTGLGGMAADSERSVRGITLRIVRPLLAVWREEIDAYVQANGLEWREDATNANPAYGTRNALRAEALPLLERVMGRDVRRALWRTADILAAEDAWFDDLLAGEGPPPAELPVSALVHRPIPLVRRILRRWLKARGAVGVGYEEVERVRSLLDVAAGGPAKVNLPGARHARRRAGKLFVE